MTFPFGVGLERNGWRPTRLREFLTRRKVTGRPDLPLLGVNLPVGVNRRVEGDGRPAPSSDLSGYQVVRRNDLVMNQLGKPHGSLGVSPFDGIISPAYFVAAIGPSAEPRYVHHLVRSRLYISEYERRGKYMPPSQFDISWEQFRDIEVSLPPLSEQRAIANYLDTETARIDALIARKRRMIELVAERRQSVTSRSLWEPPYRATRLKYVTGLPTSGNRDHSAFTHDDEGVPCLRGLNIRPAEINPEALLRISKDDHQRLRNTALEAGDLVIVRSGLAGSAAVIPDDFGPVNCVDLVVVRRSPALRPKYLEYVVNSREAQEEVKSWSAGALLTHFNAVDAGNLTVPMRSLADQDRILGSLDEEVGRVIDLSSRLKAQIGLLVEHRQALITSVLTGELDVPGVAA